MPDATQLLTADDYEAWAKANLDTGTFDFIAGGAGTEYTLRENCEGYARLCLIPKVLRDVTEVSTAATLFGRDVAAPLFMSPIGMQRLVNDDAELATARAARELNIGMAVPTVSNFDLETVGAAAGPLVMFQLYWRKDRDITEDLVLRAAAAGYSAILLTVDTSVIGPRLRDLRNQYSRPPTVKYANFTKYEDDSIKDTGGKPNYFVANQMDRSLTWKDIEWLRSLSDLPIVLKGVLDPGDARRAIDSGAGGVMVSNHGGRQLDHGPGAIDALPDIVDAVDGQALVFVDGGVRTATDVALALALGADAVGIGRPTIWATAHGGTESVVAFYRRLMGDLENAMTLLGARSLSELDRTFVRRLVRMEHFTTG